MTIVPYGKEHLKWLVLLTLCTSFVTSLYQMRPLVGYSSIIFPCNNESLWENEFRNVLPSTRCTPRSADPFDESVAPFLKSFGDLSCPDSASHFDQKPLVYAVGKTLFVDHKIASRYNNPITCWYRPFERESETRNVYGRPEILEDSVDITDEFVQVHCIEENGPLMYVDIFAFMVPKPKVELRCNKALKNRPRRSKSPVIQIVMLELGSTSLANFQRHMNRSYNFIRKHLTWVQLTGYSKLASDTYSNVVPLLTGRLQSEVADTTKQQADILPFIWADFAKHGFRTLYAEDSFDRETFNHKRKGFYNQPTDYYLRPMALQFDLASKRQTWKSGCWNYRPESSVILQWVEDFTDMFADDPFFAFAFFNRFMRDDINGLQLYDKILLRFLDNLYSKGRFENIFLFVISDHGDTRDNFHQTYQGLSEGNRPLALLVLPGWLNLKYPLMYENLVGNSNKLTTPLDVFDTLRDLAHFSKVRVRQGQVGHGRSISLFAKRVLANRTCEEAAIPLPFCSCLEFQPVSTSHCQVTNAALSLVDKINSFTASQRRKCAFLEPLFILDAYAAITGPHSSSLVTGKSLAFAVIVQVNPGHGIYQGLVLYDTATNTWTSQKEITRLDSFDSNRCVSSFLVKPYCYCLQQRKRYT